MWLNFNYYESLSGIEMPWSGVILILAAQLFQLLRIPIRDWNTSELPSELPSELISITTNPYQGLKLGLQATTAIGGDFNYYESLSGIEM